VLYAALLQAAPAAVVALIQRLFQRAASLCNVEAETEAEQGAPVLVARCLRLMAAKPLPSGTAELLDPQQRRRAELDFILCRGLIALMEEAEPSLFAEQKQFLLEEFPAEHGFDVCHGDLALLPSGMEGLLRALHGGMNGDTGGARAPAAASGMRWRVVPPECLRTPAGLLSELCTAARLPGTVVLAGRAGDVSSGQPDLDHWFVVHGLELGSTGNGQAEAADGGAVGGAIGGKVWNYAGHAGPVFELTGSAGGTAEGWFELGFHSLVVVECNSG
jgi:hypothetical protein